MIRIKKPARAPAILRGRGAEATRALCDRYDQESEAFDRGSKTFDFNSGIYGAKSVKNALIRAQHGKCAFCESKVTHIAYGDVEHYRPKGGFAQKGSDPLGRPGYYWLAYDWTNLLFCCQLCNQRFKKNLFPLADATARAHSHRDDLGRERPLFLNPAIDDPAQHIQYREEVAFPLDASPRGRATIKELGLNRPELTEVRLDHLQILKVLKLTLELVRAQVEQEDAPAELGAKLREIQQRLEASQADDAPFAAMARALLASE